MSLQTVGKSAKYGLVKAAPLKRPALAAFSNNDEDDDDGDGSDEDGSDVRRQQDSKRANIARANQMLMARQTTLTSLDQVAAYDLDGDADATASRPSAESQLRSSALNGGGGGGGGGGDAQPKAKYIDSMLATARVREKEKERIFDRKLLRERQQEDELYPDREKFVTAAYKQKLQEQDRWEAEDKRQEALEQKHDVRTQGMAGFYSNLLTKNVAVGSDVSKAALSAYTAGSERQQRLVVGGPGKVADEGQEPGQGPGQGQGPEVARPEPQSKLPQEPVPFLQAKVEAEASAGSEAQAQAQAQALAQAQAQAQAQKISEARARFLQRKAAAAAAATAATAPVP